jgi:hypothetical protein
LQLAPFAVIRSRARPYLCAGHPAYGTAANCPERDHDGLAVWPPCRWPASRRRRSKRHVLRLARDLQPSRDVAGLGKAALDRHIWLGCAQGVILRLVWSRVFLLGVTWLPGPQSDHHRDHHRLRAPCVRRISQRLVCLPPCLDEFTRTSLHRSSMTEGIASAPEVKGAAARLGALREAPTSNSRSDHVAEDLCRPATQRHPTGVTEVALDLVSRGEPAVTVQLN